MTADVRVETSDSLHRVEAGAWNALAGPDDFYQSHEWLLAIEADRTAESRYLMAFTGGRLAGALPLYHVKFEGNASYKPERFQALLGAKGRYLIAGARRCYRSTVPVRGDLSGPAGDAIVGSLIRAALDEAAGRGLSGIILPYLPTATLRRLGRVVPLTAAFDSAEAVLPAVGAGIQEYLSRLSHDRRKKARREMRAFTAARWHLGAERLSDTLGDAARLVSQVEQRHGLSTPEILLRRVYARQAAVDHRSVVLTCRDSDGSLVACNIFYAWHDALYGRAFGVDYRRCESFEYFNLAFYGAIEYAAAHGLDRVHLGIEPSRAKLHRGAVASPLWTALITLPAGDRHGVHIMDPGAMHRWAGQFTDEIPQAFPADQWAMPDCHDHQAGWRGHPRPAS
jgi:predicted N-acyltransferase